MKTFRNKDHSACPLPGNQPVYTALIETKNPLPRIVLIFSLIKIRTVVMLVIIFVCKTIHCPLLESLANGTYL